MDHHAHLTRLRDPEGLCGALVVDPVDLLDFNEVVSGPEAPDLVLAACGRPLADLREVGVFESAARLDVVGVVGPRVPLVDRPADALRRELREVLPRDFGDAAFAHAARDVLEARIRQRTEVRTNIFRGEVRPDETDPAIDVVPDPAGRNHPVIVVECRDPADRESIPPVNIGHGHGRPEDPGHRRDVRDLLRRLILSELRQHRFADEHQAVRAHRGLVRPRDFVPERVDLVQRAVPSVAHGHREGRLHVECS